MSIFVTTQAVGKIDMLMAANRAADEGPSRFDWWPDWRGQAAAIIASGPSAKGQPIAALRGKARVIAIKENIDLCPWADVVYGCDAAWWKHRRGLPGFGGLRIAWEASACDQFKDLRRIQIEDKLSDRLFMDEPGKIGAGGNSGFQALNLAVQFGANRILLIGYDLSDRSGVHWYGRNTWPMANNPNEANFIRWRRALTNASAQLADMGVEIVSTSQLSKIAGIPRRGIEDTLRTWS